MKVILDMQDSKKAKALLEFLKELPFVKVEEKKKERKTVNLEEIFGLWKGRDITKESIRVKAWRM
ncbi:MAG TPA: hypothetical protein ENI35_01820 [Candidatus Desulfofervidus auxilii]|uniref:Uncharacterized protein n=1 Tax=Desulfofervidus auxilii TaxID=1621989 RepID=A0A7C1VM79_DESA2|nr:hypothetical protein [Candidatus Desulfofervidus auxilii]